VAFDELHRQIRDAGRFADVMNGDDVGMRQHRGGSRFELEPPARVVVGQVGRKDLERNRAAESGIARRVHLAHPAGADLGEHFVASEARRSRAR
jgi:hypothetical protein